MLIFDKSTLVWQSQMYKHSHTFFDTHGLNKIQNLDPDPPVLPQYIVRVIEITLQDISAITSHYTLINMYLFQFDLKKG